VCDVKVFLHRALEEQRKENVFLRQLINDFKAHKEGALIPYFGRETSYERPPSIIDSELLHIHILHESSRAYRQQQAAIRRGNPRDPFGLRCDMDRPEHDRALIYTIGLANRNYYYVLDYFSGNAHELANNSDRMRELAKRADAFRSIY